MEQSKEPEWACLHVRFCALSFSLFTLNGEKNGAKTDWCAHDPLFVCFKGFELYSQFLTSSSNLIQGKQKLPGSGDSPSSSLIGFFWGLYNSSPLHGMHALFFCVLASLALIVTFDLLSWDFLDVLCLISSVVFDVPVKFGHASWWLKHRQLGWMVRMDWIIAKHSRRNMFCI